MTAILPAGARRAWLRRFGGVTRRADWPDATPSIMAARMAAESLEQDVYDLGIPQTSEVVVCERGALGADAAPRMLITHDGVTLELLTGPMPMPSDRAWDVWTVVV